MHTLETIFRKIDLEWEGAGLWAVFLLALTCLAIIL